MSTGDQAKESIYSGPVSSDNGPTTFGAMDAQAIAEHSHDSSANTSDKAAADTIISRAITEGWSAEQLRNSNINPAFLNQALDQHKQAMESNGSNPDLTKAQNDEVKAKEMAQLQQGIMGAAGLGALGGLFGDGAEQTNSEKRENLSELEGAGNIMAYGSLGTMAGIPAVPAVANQFGGLSKFVHPGTGAEHAHEEDLFVSIRPGQTPAPAMAAARAQQEARNEQFVRGASTPR